MADVTADYWDRAQNVNLRHHFFAAQAVHPQMRELGFGSIINLSSIAWRRGAGEMPAYSAAKAGHRRADARAGSRLRLGQHPRQCDRAGRGDDRPSTRAMVQDAGIDRRDRSSANRSRTRCSATTWRGWRCFSRPTTAAWSPSSRSQSTRGFDEHERKGACAGEARTRIRARPQPLWPHLSSRAARGRRPARQSQRRGPRRLHRHCDRTRREGPGNFRPVAAGAERRRAPRAPRSARGARHDAHRQLRA